MNVLDLYAGVGGFSLAAHAAGFAVPLAIDLDKDVTASRPRNFPKSRILHADIASLDPTHALNVANLKARDVTGIVGGPPCQGFSCIGARDPNDTRNTLVLDFFRFIKVLEPSFFVLENVPGILDQPFRSFLDRGLDSLGKRYSIVGPLCVDAAKFGAATRRVRVIVVGYRSERVDMIAEDDITAMQKAKSATVYDAIHDLPGPMAATSKGNAHYARYDCEPDGGIAGAYARRARRLPAEGLASADIRQYVKAGLISGFNPTNHTAAVSKRFAKLTEGERDGVSKCPRLAWTEPCPTLRAGTGADRGSYQSIRPIHPREHRVITIREAARLQGFPDWFQFHPTQWHSFRMIGNSISPMVATPILTLLKKRTEP